MTISEAFEVYKNDRIIFSGQSHKTEEQYVCALRILVKYKGGDFPLSEFTFAVIRDWKRWMEKGAPAQDQKALAPRTVRGYILSTRKVLKYMRKLGHDCLDPDMIVSPKKVEKPPHVITPQEVAFLIKTAGDTPRCSKLIRIRNQAIISLLYSSGLRVSEMCNLDREDIRGNVFTVFGKGQKTGQCVIDERSRIFLNTYLLLRDDVEPALFVENMKGNRLTTGTVQALFRRLSKRAKLKKPVHPHTLRHSYATNLMENGCHIYSLMRLMRHSNMASTQVYLHMSDPALVEDHTKYHTV